MKENNPLLVNCPYCKSELSILVSSPNISSDLDGSREKKTDENLTEIQTLVMSYKAIKEVPLENKYWDRVNFKRCARSAKNLLGIVGDLESSQECMASVADSMDRSNISWTFETIVKHADDWLRMRKKNGVS